MNPKVDEFLANTKNWTDELSQLRMILLQSDLTEEIKWRQPCYTLDGKNICIIGGFKEYCILSFFKGVLLKDKKKLLVQQGENTQSARVMKFTSVNEIIDKEIIIKAYIHEAIENEKAGRKVEKKEQPEIEHVEELVAFFDDNPQFKKAFEALTPGRQRGYNIFFGAAKASATRTRRIERYKSRIMDGFGMNDCICGLSKKMPSCDGSHKFINI